MHAKSFHADAKRYSAFRPNYTGGLLAHLAQALAAAPPTTGPVLDVGSGTGIFTRQLRECLPASISVIGIEPSDAMREKAIDLAGRDTNLTYAAGAAERLPVEATSARAVVAAAAAHWFDRPAFFAEAGRVLRPSGPLAIVEYVRDEARSPAAAALIRFTADHGGPATYGRPDYAEELAALESFTQLDVFQETAILHLTAEQYIGLALSSSHARPAIEKLGAARAEELLRGLGEEHAGSDGLIPFGYIFQSFMVRRR
ncbi:hypothetical protein GCM10007276_09760 [Agaricicola taiwanensis]|uniref:Methyltransferase type 11 domain-containing protein n=1 Tax=Agaricicola taiwanensis TaxID=591372 RepID=A0A8J2YGD8_9RHOB|nr:class I SAM-dependent methyltransferase [Agaricicola taiwanensis]GGE34424.1 hypothetical protein GCM10007276_09760 [Agaricicola taiwanensis]